MHENGEQSDAYATVLAQAPDLLACSEPLHELGVVWFFLFVC